MKTKLFSSIGRLGLTSSALVAFGLLLAAPVARAALAADLLEEAIYAEETKGDIERALRIYQQIVADPAAERAFAAQAQLRVGLCQLKLGDKPQAISALDRLRQTFPDKDELLGIVEQQMPRVLEEIVQEIERNYLLDVDRTELMETAIRAIVGRLDSGNGFFRAHDLEFLGVKELNQVNEQLEQKIAGIGAVLKSESEQVLVRSPLAGSPALEAGLRAGDRIVTIDNNPLPTENALETAVQLLRGPAGTKVIVGVNRAGWEDPIPILITRGTVRLPSILGDRRREDHAWEFMLEGAEGVGYVRVAYIGHQSAAELRAAIEELLARGMKGLILDLRNSPGGLLDGAVAISDLFVGTGRIVTVKGRHGEEAYDAQAAGTFTDLPMAVLINRNTASATEIVAACLQDHGRATLIGERTYGQGIVRSLFQLKSGIGAMKLPVAAYYRPSGKAMNRFPDSKDSDDWGVRPDPSYEVVLSDDELKRYEEERAARDAVGDQTPAAAGLDRQLARALEWLQRQPGQR